MDIATTGPEPLATPQGPYAGYLRRFAALVLDGWLLLLLGGLAGLADKQGASLLLGWAYAAFLESSPLQATPGKLALGLIVTDDAGGRVSFFSASVRHWLRFFTLCRVALYCFFAYVLQLRELGLRVIQEKPWLHDRWARALVVDAAPGGRAWPVPARAGIAGAVAAAYFVLPLLLPAPVPPPEPQPEPAPVAQPAPAPAGPLATDPVPDHELGPEELDKRLFSRLLGACRQEVTTVCRDALGDRPKTMACLRAKADEVGVDCRAALPTVP